MYKPGRYKTPAKALEAMQKAARPEKPHKPDLRPKHLRVGKKAKARIAKEVSKKSHPSKPH